jgi:Mn-dependent DtxR family transcriptional regulator
MGYPSRMSSAPRRPAKTSKPRPQSQAKLTATGSGTHAPADATLAQPASPPPARSNGKLSARQRGGLTESGEDYLECIDDLISRRGYARVSDVAEQLAVNRASVSIMVKRLAELGFLDHERYRGFTLTAEGAKVAQSIRERHTVLTALMRLMRLPDDVIHSDVEGIEHHVSAPTLAAFRKLVAHWHGDPAALERFHNEEAPAIAADNPRPADASPLFSLDGIALGASAHSRATQQPR